MGDWATVLLYDMDREIPFASERASASFGICICCYERWRLRQDLVPGLCCSPYTP